MRRRRWRWVVLGFFILLVLFAADLAWSGSRAVDGFRRARDSLTAGGVALQSGNVPEARVDFAAATSASNQASAALRHASIAALGRLPWFDDDFDAARRGIEALDLAARGGIAYADAAEIVGWDGSTVPGFAPGGHIDAAALHRAAPSVAQAADLIGQADSELSPIDPTGLLSPIGHLVGDAQQEVHMRAGQAMKAAELARLLPPMLGGDGERTYLLVTLSPSDPRGSGGYPGVYGLLHVDGDRLTLSDLAPTSQIPEVPPVPGPADAKQAWHWAGIDRFFWDTTYTPDFPTAAGFMKGIWEASGGQPVDGVVAGDPALMASLLQVVGPVESLTWPETITADNVEAIVGADVYRTTSQPQSDAWEVGMGMALWYAVLSRPWPVEAMATATSEAVLGGHLQVWSAHTEEEQKLGALGVTGAFQMPTYDDPQVTLNGFSANRAGYFATTDVQVEPGTDEKGRAVTTVTVTVQNHAPNGPPSILLGIHPKDVGGKALGTFATDVNVYLPNDATVSSFRVNGRHVIPFEWDELGAHAVSWPPFIEPGETATIEVSYRALASGGETSH
jgi:hypothetical protein